MEEEENRALQSINETPAEKAAKRRKLNEEVEDLKRHLEIMLDEDDDVYTEATPLRRKVLVVDYEIIKWNLVKERFSTLKPKNFSDDFFLKSGRIKADIVSGKKVPTLKVYSRLDAKCCKTSGQRG
nr:hypothetical protein [Tanacetum cinerariifolium]